MANIEIVRDSHLSDKFDGESVSFVYITNVPEDQQPSRMLWFTKPMRTFWIMNPDPDKLYTHKLDDEEWKMVNFLEDLGINLDTHEQAAHPGGKYLRQAVITAYGNRILVKVRWGYDI